MRAYHTLVFDEMIEGTAAVYSDPSFNGQLASTEKVELAAVVDTVSGTTPTLTVRFQEGPDGIHWRNKNGTAEINGVSISAVPVPLTVGLDSGANQGSGLQRLEVTLAGTTPKAHVRIWATGRGEVGG